MQQWPEGPEADPAAARERYDFDMKTARGALREVFRADLPAANFGLVMVMVSVIAGVAAGPAVGAGIGGAFAVLFLATLLVMFLRGVRGEDALQRAYLSTFGWVNWI
ncbi:MAG: hypothetical protein HOZ81_01820 [Streptomyces sp.]|nr:hypothetical protein [Streptomyces sp.]